MKLFPLWFVRKDDILIYNKAVQREVFPMFILLAGGLLVIVVAVVIAVVSAVTSAVAAETDSTDD